MSGHKLRVGFVGLGIMGQPMAGNILRAGFSLTVYNRTISRTEPLKDAGAVVVDSPAKAAAESDIVICCVSDSPDVYHVVLAEKTGIISGVRKGSIVVDCSTAAPEVATKCSQELGKKGVSFLDAPVSGGDAGAKAGMLSIMVGGRKEDFDRARPVLETMGKTIVHCGSSGAGYIVKLCNQILVSMNCLAVAEALSFAQKAGIDSKAMLQAVSGGAAGSWQLSNLGPKMVADDYAPGFFVDYLLKDLCITHGAAQDLKVPLPGTALAETLFRAASAQSFGREGTQAIYKVVRGLQRQQVS
ncbi:MAG: NAD-binding protein [Actinobacteria bacterium]|nr:NAD-binding protein [Actinomycetota bacterium]